MPFKLRFNRHASDISNHISSQISSDINQE